MASDVRNLALLLVTDGVMLFARDARHKGGYSLWPITLVVLNFPPFMRCRPAATCLAGVVPGPHPRQLQSFLQPIVDQLNLHHAEGIRVIDSAWQETDAFAQEFDCHLKLILATGDYKYARMPLLLSAETIYCRLAFDAQHESQYSMMCSSNAHPLL